MGLTFDSTAFGHAIVGNRARRWLKAQFDALGPDAIAFAIENNKSLLDYAPIQLKAQWKKQAKEFSQLIPKFTNNEVYTWIPTDWRALIESIPNGRVWAFHQIVLIRQESLS